MKKFKPKRLASVKFNFLIILVLIMGACGGAKEASDNQAGNEQEVSSQALMQTRSFEELMNASLNGQIIIVKDLIEQEIDLNAADPYGRTALMLAAYNGHTEIARILIQEGAEVTKEDKEGRTALIFAASGPFPEPATLLLNQGAKVDLTDNVGQWSALMFASAEGNNDVVKILLEHGADINLKDKDGETALDFAQNNGHTEVATLIDNY